MILQFKREEIVAFADAGMMNKKSPLHWDVCLQLAKGKTMEVVADDFRISFETVRQIKCRKCPDLK
jgi:hypothetical protein